MKRLVVAALAAVLMVPATVAAAAAPANDNFADAASITSLPFDRVVDLTNATTEAGEEGSACFQSSRSVWYRFDTTASYILSVSIEDASPDAGVRIFLDYGGGPFLAYCVSALAPTFDLIVGAGYTMYFQVAADTGTTGALHLSTKPLVSVSATIETSATLDRATGTVVIRGTVTCNKPAWAQVFVSLSQRQGRRVEYASGGWSGIPCGAAPTAWTAVLYGSLVAGSAGLEWAYGASNQISPYESVQVAGPSGTIRIRSR